MSDVGDCYGNDGRYSQCMSATFGWAVGGEPYDYPADVGFAIGTPDDPQYVRIEIHYSNFENKQGIKDSSGIRISYTPELRPHDCGTLMVGVFTFPIHFIPPGSEEFRSYGLCDTRMMEDMLGRPIPDLTVKSFLLHGHLTAYGVRILHYRNGTLIGSLGEDKKYDFNFQQVRHFPKDLTIKMGDQIVVECTSNTMDREGVTFGGPSTLNEMCAGFLFYYPIVPIAACWSFMDIQYITEALGLERGETIMDAVMNIDSVEWDDESRAAAQKAVMDTNHLIIVENREGKRLNKTTPLPPISLPPPYHCEDDSLE
ncbi:DBH-like monooxygenase protein 2 isoform X1 [Dendropsophus ebraccatus]|uniref:DBH-like monooxygenase protein 2 isoform X1 n=1 Tax=Dendropsophus ebraccatus TaxID=150705 RepID=UPI003831F9E0